MRIECKREVAKTDRAIPRNGILLQKGAPVPVVSEVETNRDMTEVISGRSVRTYSLPPTTLVVGKDSFRGRREVRSVRLNEGLKKLEHACFMETGIRELILASTTREVGPLAFRESSL